MSIQMKVFIYLMESEQLQLLKKHIGRIFFTLLNNSSEQFEVEVTAHNAIPAVDAATVFVQSKEDPQFHTFVIVGIDVENNALSEIVSTREGEAEKSIFAGLYVNRFQDEFNQLDQLLAEFVEEFNLLGLKQDAINNVMSTGYTTPYYFVQGGRDEN